MNEPLSPHIRHGHKPHGLGGVGRMTDEQLLTLRALFQTIDKNNNGSITPSLLAEFFKQEGANLDIRAIEDFLDTLGAEHSLPFRRFLVFAPAIIGKLPDQIKWIQISAKDSDNQQKAETKATPQMTSDLNRKIVESQAQLDKLKESIAAAETTLAALHLKINLAEGTLEELNCKISDKELQLETINLVQPLKAKKDPSSNPSTPHQQPIIDIAIINPEEGTSLPVVDSSRSHYSEHSETDSGNLSPKERHVEVTTTVSEIEAEDTSKSPNGGKNSKSEEDTAPIAENKPLEEQSPTTHDAPIVQEHTSPEVHTTDSTAKLNEDLSVSSEGESPEDSSNKPTQESSTAVTEPEPVPAVAPVIEEKIIVNSSDEIISKSDSGTSVSLGQSKDSIDSTASQQTSSDSGTPDSSRRKHKEKSLGNIFVEVPIKDSSSKDKKPKKSHREKEKNKSRDSDTTPVQAESIKKDKKKEKEKGKLKEKEKEKEKEKDKSIRKGGSSSNLSNPNLSPVTKSPKKSLKLDDVSTEDDSVLNASASGTDILRTPKSGKSTSRRDSTSPTRISRTASLSTPRAEVEYSDEKMALIDPLYFASVDVKLQAIIEGLQPYHEILDLSYFNLVVYTQGLNAQLTTVATNVPSASTVPASLRKPATPLATRQPSKILSSLAVPVAISPSSPTPSTTSFTRVPLTGHQVLGPYFTMASGEMINSLGAAVVQCANTLLILIQDSRSKTHTYMSSLCSAWKFSLYKSICDSYHAVRALIIGITSDMAQYLFPSAPPPADDLTLVRTLSSTFNAITMPPTLVNEEYISDPVALNILKQEQQQDIQLITRQAFAQYFEVYFGSGEIMDRIFYLLDPWNTQSISIKRFAEFLRLYGSIVGSACLKQLETITDIPGFQGYLTEGVVLSLLEAQQLGTYCLWFNKARPKLNALNLAWMDPKKEVVTIATIVISFDQVSNTANFAFEYEATSVTTASLPELIDTLREENIITNPFYPQFPRSSVFHGDLESSEAETLLSKEADGTLLFRLSSKRGSLAVSYVFRGKVGHTLLKITSPDSYEYSGQVYKGVAAVIQGHAQIFRYIFDASSLTRQSHAKPVVYL